MVAANGSASLDLNYPFLLLAHVICADQQIHSEEAKALKEIAVQAKINELTIAEAEKILDQDETCLTLLKIAERVPIGQRTESLRQILAISYLDGFFSPLEGDLIKQVAQLWGYESEVEKMREQAQGFGKSRTKDKDDDVAANLSIGAKLLQGAESVLSRSLITKLADLAPQNVGQQIKRLQREILLSGPEYDAAIERCAKVAAEDFKYVEQALRHTYSSLQDLGHSLQPIIQNIKQKTIGQGEYNTAKDVAKQLEKTRQQLSAEILHDLESVRESLRAKQRALKHFSIAFMGRTKAGKSTLHAVITGEGWDAIGIGKQRTTRYNRVYEWKNIRIIDTPGIGAPGGESDEDIARSIIEESDVICYVITNDSIQESEFAFLKVLKEKTKPLIILLNIQKNLRNSGQLERFLRDPGRDFAVEGHLNRINRYAKQHYNIVTQNNTIIMIIFLLFQ